MARECPRKCHIWSIDPCCKQQRIERRTEELHLKSELEDAKTKYYNARKARQASRKKR